MHLSFKGKMESMSLHFMRRLDELLRDDAKEEGPLLLVTVPVKTNNCRMAEIIKSSRTSVIYNVSLK